MADMEPVKGSEARGVEALLVFAENGLLKHVKEDGTLLVGRVVYTRPKLLEEIAKHRGPFKESRELRIRLKQKIVEREHGRDAAEAFLKDLEVSAQALLGRENPELVDFGFKPRKKTVLTSEQKALRAAKARETRARRRTMGRRQKEAIKGDVESLTIAADGSRKVVPAPNGGTPNSTPPGGRIPS